MILRCIIVGRGIAMPKLSKKKLDPRDMGVYINNLWSAFALMESKLDIKLLFKDIFTHTEIKMLAKRLEIARRCIENENYNSISIALGVTAGTIASVSNILYSKGEGFRKAHKKLLILEGNYIEKQKEMRKNLENPFRQKAKRKTVLGALLKTGIHAVDAKLSRHLKQKSASGNLDI